MFAFPSLGTPELIVILIVALLIFGSRLPSVMRSLGRSVNEFKKGVRDVTDDASEVQNSLNEATGDLLADDDADDGDDADDADDDEHDA
jgi:sec-independent protein translocase protein TatA